MIGLESGMLVQHASLGLGKVVAVEPTAVHVVFAAQGARVATKLRLPMALPLLGPPAGSNAWLSGLSGFTLDPRTGRYSRATTWLSHPDAVARFTGAFPLAFEDPAYTAPERPGARAARWRRAHAAFVAAFGDGQAERHLAAGDVAGLVERTAKIERIVSPILREPRRMNLAAGGNDVTAVRGFFAAVFELLSADAADRGRFEALAASVAALAPGGPAPESAWPLVTWLPFVARPEVHMLLRPHAVCDAAQRLGLELVYEAAPSWATYVSLLEAARNLLDKLRPLGARDHIDVEAFMHVVLASPARPKPQPRAKVGVTARASASAAGADEDADSGSRTEDESEDDAEAEL